MKTKLSLGLAAGFLVIIALLVAALPSGALQGTTGPTESAALAQQTETQQVPPEEQQQPQQEQQRQPVENQDHGQIVRNASQAFRDLESFQGVADVTVPLNGDRFTSRVRILYQDPNNFRIEALEPADGISEGATAVFNGDTLWLYSPDTNEVTVVEGAPSVMFIGRTPEPLLRSVTQILGLPRSFESLQENSEVVFIAEDFVSGRETNLYQVVPRMQTEQFGSQWVWIDTETNLPVKMILTRPSGRQLFGLTFAQFQPNAEVPEGAFTFEVPEGATVNQPDIADLSVELGWRDVTLEQARVEAGFPILTWEPLPEGLGLRFVRLGELREAQGENPNVVAMVFERDGRDDTVLIQNAARAETPDLPSAETVEFDGFTAEVLTANDSTVMTWIEGETRVTMITEQPRDQAIEMARALEAR